MLNSLNERFSTLVEDLCDTRSHPDFIDALKRQIAVSSDVQETNLRGISRLIYQTVRSEPSPIASRNDRFQRAFNRDSARPHEPLRSTIERWISEPPRFLEGSSDSILHSHILSISTAYTKLRRDDIGRAINTIQRHFFLVSLYDAVVGGKYHSGSVWFPRAKHDLTRFIASEVKEAQDTVLKHIELYVDYGRAFSLWAQELGGRYYLLILPTDIPESLYAERHAILKIKQHAENFLNLGIRQIAEELSIARLGSWIEAQLRIELPSRPSRRRDQNAVSNKRQRHDGTTSSPSETFTSQAETVLSDTEGSADDSILSEEQRIEGLRPIDGIIASQEPTPIRTLISTTHSILGNGGDMWFGQVPLNSGTDPIPAQQSLSTEMVSRSGDREDGADQTTQTMVMSQDERLASSTQCTLPGQQICILKLPSVSLSPIQPTNQSEHPPDSYNNSVFRDVWPNSREQRDDIWTVEEIPTERRALSAPTSIAFCGLIRENRDKRDYQSVSGPFDAFRMWSPHPVTFRTGIHWTFNGLIKASPNFTSPCFQNTEAALMDFYRNSFCPGRTLLLDNVYQHEVLRIASESGIIKNAVLLLAASYFKEYLEEGSQAKKLVVNTEIVLIQSLTHGLREEPLPFVRNTAMMFLTHHAILNPGVHPMPGQQTDLILATHAILLFAILPANDRYRFQKLNYDWVGRGEATELTKVNGTLGTSRMTLYYQILIRKAIKGAHLDWNWLLSQIKAIKEWVDLDETENAKFFALKTASTYQLSTQLLVYGRLLKQNPHDKSMKTTYSKLVVELSELPSSGPNYTGLHPAWCFVIACICTAEESDYAQLLCIFKVIGMRSKSNVLPVCTLMEMIWVWKTTQVWADDWWEKLAQFLVQKLGD